MGLRRPRGDCAGAFPKRGAWALVVLSLIVATSIALPPMSATAPPSWGAFQPDGGEILAGGSYYDIRWNATHGGDPTLFVTIALISWGFVTAGDFPTGGAVWKWHVPTVDIPSARIRACAVAYDGSRACRESSANFSVVMAPPYVGILSPADGAENVSLDAPIILAFDPPPDPSTFQLPIILPPVPLLSVMWSGDTTLVLQHTLFAECTLYSVFLTYTDPSPDPTVWRFTTLCPSPRVLDFGFVAAVNGSVWVSFNKPMDRLETYATISPEVPLVATWNANNTYVTLRPSPSFEPCTTYTAELFGGKDLLGNPGVVEPGPIPNPFSFTTECLSPVSPDVTDTNPANATVDVPIIAPVFLNFSRSMDTASVRAVISPVVTVTYTWTNNNMSLRLNHATLFTECTGYTVTVSGNDTNGNSLGPGGLVPNPWSFSTVCPVSAPGNLRVSRVEPDVVRLAWNAAASADSYRVYESSSRFAPWPWAVLGTTAATSFDAIPHLTDGATHYYIVRAVRSFAVSANSTMAVKIQMNVGFSSTTSNVRWFSLPYRSDYARASEIATEVGPSKIDVIAKWNPATQTPILYYYFRGAWRGTDFSIAAGDGLYLGSVSAFSWVIVGTDRAISMPFTLNNGTLGNVNWISLPWASAYRSARDIVIDIEGSTGPGANTRIFEVGKWDYSSQRLLTYRWTATGWTGSDFAVMPGDGTFLRIVASFDWQPRFIQPPVP